MTTPAPHTPINFVHGGASMAWSEECVKALMECGYHPDDFGDYDHVRMRIRTAKRRVEQQNAHDNAPPPPPPRPAAPNPPVTAHERFLAGSQSGHLTQDATQRAAGARNGTACDNTGLVEGYNIDRAPCMPHHGSAQAFGTQHNLVSIRESEQPYARTPPPPTGAPYPRAQLDADIHARTREALQHRMNARNPRAQPAADPYGAAGKPGYFGPNPPGGAANPAAANARTVIAPNAGAENRSPVDVAAECIDNFRKVAEEAAKRPWLPPKEGETEQQAFDRHIRTLEAERDATTAEAQHAAAAGADAARTRKEELEREYEELTRREDRAGSDGVSRRGELRRATAALSEARRATPSNPTTVARNVARVQAATARREQLAREIDAQEDAMVGCERAASRAAGLQCEIDQARRVFNGTATNNPRVPAVNPQLGINPTTNVPEADRIRREIQSRRQGGGTGSAPTSTF